MRRLAQISLALTLTASPLTAQTGGVPAPVPGPYMVMPQAMVPPQSQTAMPRFTPQRFAMPMPYWMQNSQRPQPPATAPITTSVTTPAQPAVGRANQQPAITGLTPPRVAQGNGNGGNTATPGFFPSYNAGPQQPARPNGTPYPTNGFAPMPWTQNKQQYGQQYGGQQGFMPMPWQNGQNGWGNNWNNGWNSNGYGFQQGYAAPNWPQQ